MRRTLAIFVFLVIGLVMAGCGSGKSTPTITPTLALTPTVTPTSAPTLTAAPMMHVETGPWALKINAINLIAWPVENGGDILNTPYEILDDYLTNIQIYKAFRPYNTSTVDNVLIIKASLTNSSTIDQLLNIGNTGFGFNGVAEITDSSNQKMDYGFPKYIVMAGSNTEIINLAQGGDVVAVSPGTLDLIFYFEYDKTQSEKYALFKFLDSTPIELLHDQIVQIKPVPLTPKIVEQNVPIQIIAGKPDDYIDALAFSPDGTMLASGGGGYANGRNFGSLILRNAVDGTIIRDFFGISDRVLKIAFSPNGTYLASAGTISGTKLWDVNTGHLMYTINNGFSEGSYLGFSPDASSLIAGRVIYNAADGKPGNSEFPFGKIIAFSVDGNNFAIFQKGSVQIYKTADSTLLQTLEFSNDSANLSEAAFSGDGTLFSATDGDSVYLWNVSDGKLLYKLQGHVKAVSGIAFSPDGSILATASEDGTVKFWQTSTGEYSRLFYGDKSTDAPGISCISFSPDGSLLALSSNLKIIIYKLK